ncbi:MAG: HAMP domain-containing sensor histidine kinase, partial [Planctomycetota bacterium]
RAVLPWMSEHLTDGAGIAGLRVINLPITAAGDEQDAAAMLIVDEDFKTAVPSDVQRQSLVAAWTAAVSAAVRSDAVDRLAGELADRHADLAEAQASLAESRSMAKLGEMTAGAAHELNNPLTVIKGYGQILRTEAEGTRFEDAAAKVADAAQQLSDLITSLHLLAEPPEPAITRAVVSEILSESMRRAKLRAGSAWTAKVVVPDLTPAIHTDRELLQQALTELVVNAAESDSDQIIEIRVQTDPFDDRLMVVVRDHGRGMDAHTRQHAFDPFFSGKPAGRGTGLGLSRARRLIELMGGTITLASEVGEGTNATITLPGWRVNPEESPAGRDAA